MLHTYRSITEATIDAIESMALEPCEPPNSGSWRMVAAGVYFAWAHLVGERASPEDCDRIEGAIRRMKDELGSALGEVTCAGEACRKMATWADAATNQNRPTGSTDLSQL